VLDHGIDRVPDGWRGRCQGVSFGRAGVSWLYAPMTDGEDVTSVFPGGRSRNARGVSAQKCVDWLIDAFSGAKLVGVLVPGAVIVAVCWRRYLG